MYVVLRGKCFAPTTSRIEQCFSRVADVLGPNRLNCSDHHEDMAVRLILVKMDDEERVRRIIAKAKDIWVQAFGHHFTRQHAGLRVDAGVLKPRVDRSSAALPGPGGVVNERQFLKRLHSEIATGAAGAAGSAERTLPSFQPDVWDESHQMELEFQRDKVRKRLVEAGWTHIFFWAVGRYYLFFLMVSSADRYQRVR